MHPGLAGWHELALSGRAENLSDTLKYCPRVARDTSSSAELLHRVFASEQLRSDNAERREHGGPAVVDLAVLHVLGLPERLAHAELEWVPVVADVTDLFSRVVLPEDKLEGTGD